jgi:predicted transposase YdaD
VIVSKPYDATAKDLLEADPAGMAALIGVVRPPEKVRLIDSDVSTVSAVTDKVIRIGDDEPWLLHVEFQSSRDLSLPRRMLQYNALLHERHKVMVASAMVLLVKQADSPAYSGNYEVVAPSIRAPHGWLRATVEFQVFGDSRLGVDPGSDS